MYEGMEGEDKIKVNWYDTEKWKLLAPRATPGQQKMRGVEEGDDD